MKGIWTALALAVCAVTAAPASAHGLLMKLEAQGTKIAGQVYFSNGDPAEHVWIEQFTLDVPATAITTVQAGPDGAFSVSGEHGQSYRLKASGDEGHSITMDISLEGDASRGRMVAENEDAIATKVSEAVPAWALLGGVLGASLIPLWWMRRKRVSA